jgi:hypothetical protein
VTGYPKHGLPPVRQQVLRCKRAAARQLALLRGQQFVDEEDDAMRASKRLADSATRFDSTYGDLEQYPALAERAVAALVPRWAPDRGPL